MFRRNVPFAALTVSVWLVAAVALAAPSSALSVSLSTADTAVEFAIANGQAQSVVASSLCDNGNFETWTSLRITSSTVELGKGPRLSRVAVVADVEHVDCDGMVWDVNVGIRTTYDDAGKVLRERDGATGTRTLTVPVSGTMTIPNDVVSGASGFQVETISR